METLQLASDWFWNPAFWLPVNFTWADIQPTEELRYPNPRDIYTYPLAIAITFLILKKQILSPYLFIPLAKYYGLNCEKPLPPKEIPELETAYQKFKGHVPKLIEQRIAEKLKMKLKLVDRWLYQRSASTKLPIGEKFADTCFLMGLHFAGFLYGTIVLYDKIWIWDVVHCWEGYPYHELDPSVWGYYIYMLGFFWTLAIGQMLQPSNSKDQLAVYAHHLFSIMLLCFSWTLNFVRIGSLILVIHEASDWLLLVGKLANYVENEFVTSIFFGLAMLTWFVTRLVIYPFWVLRSAFFVAPTYMFMPSAYMFIFLMASLLVLNCIWMGMMISALVNKLKYGKLKDDRSSDPMSDEESENEL